MPKELWRARNAYTRTECILHESNWDKHAARRPAIVGCEEAVRQTVEDPDFVLEDAHGVLYKYRSRHGCRKYRGLLLLVVEAGDADKLRSVRTMYFTKRIKEVPLVYAKRLPFGRRHGGRR